MVCFSFESRCSLRSGFLGPLSLALSREGRGNAQISHSSNQTACCFALTAVCDAFEKHVPSPLAGEVITRHAGEIRHWDIAHHMKAGLGPTRPALNPRPGWRVALGHSMGHVYGAGDGAVRLKILAEPMALLDGGALRPLPYLARLAAP